MADTDQLVNIASPIVERYGCDLVQLSFAREKPGWVLRVLIEKAGSDPATGSGVDHQMCSGVSRELGDLIESEDLIDKAFVLEVSSPGIERPLEKVEDFQKFANREARIKTKHVIDGRKRFQGKLLGADSSCVRIAMNSGKKIVEIPHESIAKANLVFDTKLVKARSGE